MLELKRPYSTIQTNMAFSDEHNERWPDRDIRRVPLPEHLLVRLKEIARGNEAMLDAALCDVEMPDRLKMNLRAISFDETLDQVVCDVTVPEELCDRLKAVVVDEAIDSRLRRVAPPQELLAGLHAIPTYPDAVVDAELRDVAVPSSLRGRLKATVERLRPLRHFTHTLTQTPAARLATAASLLLVLGTAYLAAMASLVMSTYSGGPVARLPLDSEKPLNLTSGRSSTSLELDATQVAETQPESMGVAPLQPNLPSWTQPASALAYRQSQVHEIKSLMQPYIEGRSDSRLLARLHPSDEFVAARVTDDLLPEMELIPLSTPRGVAPPPAKSFDLRSLYVDQVHPFVYPDNDRDLHTSHVPLVTRTDSIDRLWRSLRRGNLPQAHEIRTEEFLAAVDYDFPPPVDNALALRAAGGPSPFADDGLSLLQVGVQASSVVDAPRRPVHLTFAIDVSSSMARSQRLQAVMEALPLLTAQLAPNDRFALISFGSSATVHIKNGSSDDADNLRQALASITPDPSTNLGEGLRLASMTSIYADVDPQQQRRIVLITDHHGDLPRHTTEQLLKLAASTASQGATLEIISLSSNGQRDQRLQQLATAGGGELHAATTSEDVRYAVLKTVTGHSQVVARDARLTITFDPRVVEKYRLLGHEVDILEGPGSLQIDLRAGQAATALYELKLRGGSQQTVATAKLSWTDPATGKTVRREQKIVRGQFVTSLRESPVSLQRAAIAAEAAEVLRGSKFAPKMVRGLQAVLESSQRLSPTAGEERTVQSLVDLIRLVDHVRAGKPVPDRDDPFWNRRSSRGF